MGGIVHTICCVAEIESNAPSDCPDCLGTTLQTTTQNEEFYDGIFPADVFVGGGSLESYRFDDEPTHGSPGEFSADLKVAIPIPPSGFTHLCLKYNREGGARINVVAINVKTIQKIFPATVPTDGLDAACPIAAATLGGDTLDPAAFIWDAGQPTVVLDQQPGAWTLAPAEGQGTLWLKARETLSAQGGSLKFVSWERNRLSKWVVGTTHQWPGDGDTIDFDSDTYVGVIARYKPVELIIGDPHVPDTKPGEITPGYPEPLREIVLGWLSVKHFLQDLQLGIFHPRRHAPERDDHGDELLARDITPYERTRLTQLANSSDLAQAELTDYLRELHRRYD